MVCPQCGQGNPDGFYFCGACGKPLTTKPPLAEEARKTVTVLFSDLVGSTALGERLDSESLREVMDGYFTEMKDVLERHGGIVEKYIGDAIMAIFGLPRAHEDDALRAVRAASEMGTALSSLNADLERYWDVTLSNRTGINTGEVVVGDSASGQRLATGDAVNVAARLEQAAPAGHVLIGESTYRLVRDAVQVEVIDPLKLKGKSGPLTAFRLIEAVRDTSVSRRLNAPMIGRESELRLIQAAFRNAVAYSTSQVVTVLGDAGAGKSRLVEEAVNQLGAAARTLRGRCLSYGEGITFWPVAEIVRQGARISDNDSASVARSKLLTALRGQEDTTAVFNCIASLMGLASTSITIEELFGLAGRRWKYSPATALL